MQWTKEQQNVIEFRNRNILVSAAAGSGKTAVLVERIIGKITDEKNPVDIDRLLVVTFTKAAAAEMRERIGNAIEKRLEECPEDENLRRQQTLLHNAQITTIDSFCLFVVRNHFEEIGLDPNFRIADPGEIKLLELDVLNEVFEQEYAKHGNALDADAGKDSFIELVDAYSDKRSNKAVKEMVAKIYTQSASNPWPKEWVSSLIQPYMVETKEELIKTDMMQGICAYVKNILLGMPERLESYYQAALSEPGLEKYAQNIAMDLEAFDGIEDVNGYDGLGTFCKKVSEAMGSLSAIRGYEGNEAKKDAVSNGRNGIKKEVKEIYERYFAMPLEELVEQLGRMRGIAEELLRLTLLYMEALEEKKREKHLMDFSDIEHAALRILVDEKTKEHRSTSLEYQNQFEEIMIDEYQDSNQVQEEILTAISREYNMFMVGDVKQSIYRFRLARPELFMEKFATYDLKESKKQRIDLHKNFRSRSEVLDFTNDMFYKIMDTDLGKVAYDTEAALYYGADYPEADDMTAEVLLYEIDKVPEGNDENAKSLGKRQLEARMVAKRIHELKESLKITDKATGKLRPLRNSDIVILFRSLSGWGNDFMTVLEACGIPAHVSTSTGYFSAVEVQTVLSFLKILDNPYQDIPMAAVLKSAIVGLDNEELAELSLAEGNSFAEAVIKQMEEATEGKLYVFAQLYKRLRDKVLDTPTHVLIDMVLEETGYGDYVKALPAGSQRKANLDMLVEKAVSYEKTSFKGLFHFIRYIDQLQKYEVDFGEADIIGENEDVVRLMTIHKSKGLEFPVVFVAGISKKFNESDSRDKMAIHPDMGLGLDEMMTSPRVKRTCLIRSEIAERIRRDNLGEELRVLYVAMTRAKEKLILTGTIQKQEKIYEAYMGNMLPGETLSFSQRVKAKSYLDWIAPAVLSYPDKYCFTFVDASDLVLVTAKEMAKSTLAKEVLLEQIRRADETLVTEYRSRFAYEYPYKQEMNKKSKYSVSELKHDSMVENYDRMEGEVEVPEFLLEEREAYVPEFAYKRFVEASEKENDKNPDGDYSVRTMTSVISASNGVNRGALRGTAVHRVMECMDFAAFLDIEQESKEAVMKFVTDELDRMVPELLTKEQYELVDKQKILSFFQSPVALRMAEADKRGDLFREKPFVMDYEGVLVQGIIDVFWLEEDKIALLDYKTDRVQSADELEQRYKKQLDLYAEAISSVFSVGKPTKMHTENLIYSFCFGQVIPLNEEV